jgi:hypothetical protein
MGRRSFDVVASLDFGGADPGGNVPATLPFTLVLDADAAHAIVGGNGTAAAVPVSRQTDGRLVLPKFSVGLAPMACAGASTVDFDFFSFAASGAVFDGKGEGGALVSCGDCQFNVPFTATVTGAADVTPPSLLAATAPTSPFQDFSLPASEPLPATATARLIENDGSHIDLTPTVVPGDVPLVVGFTKPKVVLPVGVGLGIALDGLVDFAGLQGSADTPVRFALFAMPPLVAQDGFESVTAAQLGGATVISDGPLPPISGAHSLYFGQGAPTPTGAAVGSSLRVRLAVQPGDTKVTFSYQLAGSSPDGGFSSTINVGSVGHGAVSGLLTMDQGGRLSMWPNGNTFYLTDVATKEIALPADVTDEVVFEITSSDVSCGRPAPSTGGVLLDDLRVE